LTGTISFMINETAAELPESAQLLSAIRDHLGLTGAKLGCGGTGWCCGRPCQVRRCGRSAPPPCPAGPTW